MAYIGQVSVVGTSNIPIAQTLYGVCETAASTAAKAVTCAAFDTTCNVATTGGTTPEGTTIAVYMQYSNTVANPTLNVNARGACPIYRYGTTAPGTTAATSWEAGAIVQFTYNKSLRAQGCWVISGQYRTDNNSADTWGVVFGADLRTSASTPLSVTAANTGKTSGAISAGTVVIVKVRQDVPAACVIDVGGSASATIIDPSTNASIAAGVIKAGDVAVFGIRQVNPITWHYLGKLGDGSSVGSLYCTSSTASNTAAKVATSNDDFTLAAGATVHVKMTYANTYVLGALTLDVNSTGAKTIYCNDAATSSDNTLLWNEGCIVTFVYDGTYWRFLNRDDVMQSLTTTYMFAASGWNSATGLFMGLETDFPSAQYDVEVFPCTSTTAAMLDAWSAARIVRDESSNNLKALGTVPTVDVKMGVKVEKIGGGLTIPNANGVDF